MDACNRQADFVQAARCAALSTILVLLAAPDSVHAEADGDILGMTTGVAVLVLVVVAFVVIGSLLCVLHRQMQLMKRSRMRARAQEMRQQAAGDGTDDDDSEALLPPDHDASHRYVTPSLESPHFGGEASITTIHVVGGEPILVAPQEDLTLLQRPLPSPKVATPKTAANTAIPRVPSARDIPLDPEEGSDEAALQHTMNKVGSWLARTSAEMPLIGTPQFVILRASSFVSPQVQAPSAADDAGTGPLYVRVNSRQRRSNTMPTAIRSATTGAASTDPFSDIPVVAEVGARNEGGQKKLHRRSLSMDSQNSDPFS